MIVSSPSLSFVTQWERLAVGVNKLAAHRTIMVAEGKIKLAHGGPLRLFPQFPPKKRPLSSNYPTVKVRPRSVENFGDDSILLVVP
jgi:hypothetical protein